jgi:hypothetical protein
VEGEEIFVRYDLPEGVDLVTMESRYGCHFVNNCLNTMQIAH